MITDTSSNPTRRSFIRGSVATAALLGAPGLRAQNDKKPIRLGFIGCGGRGSFVAGIVKDDGGFEFAAAADYFQDQVDTFGDAFGVPKEARFTGLDGFRKMLASGKVDAVAIHSPPYFHVEHAEGAIDAGKHMLVAKPVAIDVPGCDRARALAKKAADKGLVMFVDVQCRGNAIFREALKRVHDGALGEFTLGECNYEADTIPLKVNEDTPGARLRNWVHYKSLGGDIITEQAIHAVDITSWALGQPVRATGSNGRSVFTGFGDTADHYSVLFEFPTGAVNFHSRQFTAWGLQFVCANRLLGTKGALLAEFGGRVMIRGGAENFWAGGVTKDLYREGSVQNVRVFREQVLAGNPDGNTTVEPAVQTTLLTLLGQMAAERKGTATFEELLREGKAVRPDLAGLKA